MSGRLNRWSQGQAVTNTELQRLADTAALSDDIGHSVLLPPGSAAPAYSKRVVPLGEESATYNPRLLVVPDAVAGRCTVRPAFYEAGFGSVAGPVIAPVVLLAWPVSDEASVAEHESTVAQDRIDVIYAVLRRSTAATGNRKVKATDGSVSTQSLPLYQDPELVFLIRKGTEGALPVAPALPADTATAWNIALAEVYLTHPFVAGTPIVQSWITPRWDRGLIPEHRVRGSRPLSGFVKVAGAILASGDLITSRHAGRITLFAPFLHKAANVAAATLDAGVDWRNRVVWISVLCPLNHAGLYPPPSQVTISGSGVSETSGPKYTGDGSAGTIWTSVGGIEFTVTVAGALQVRIPAAAPADPVNGDNYLVTVETLDRFVGM